MEQPGLCQLPAIEAGEVLVKSKGWCSAFGAQDEAGGRELRSLFAYVHGAGEKYSPKTRVRLLRVTVLSRAIEGKPLFRRAFDRKGRVDKAANR